MSGDAAVPVGSAEDAPSVALRRASLAAFVLLLAQYGIGMGVNLYVTVPATDHGIGDAIANGPAALSVHVVVGLLLVLAAVGLVFQAVIAGRRAILAISVVGLVAMVAAAAAGSAFVDMGRASASMAMAMFTGVGLLAYGSTSVCCRPAGAKAGRDAPRRGPLEAQVAQSQQTAR